MYVQDSYFELWVEGWGSTSDRWFEDTLFDISQYQCVLTVALSRVTDRCSVSADVTGDVNGAFFGDVAFFNVSDEATPVPLDPAMVGMLDGLLNMATNMANNPEDPDAPPEHQSFAEALC